MTKIGAFLLFSAALILFSANCSNANFVPGSTASGGPSSSPPRLGGGLPGLPGAGSSPSPSPSLLPPAPSAPTEDSDCEQPPPESSASPPPSGSSSLPSGVPGVAFAPRPPGLPGLAGGLPSPFRPRFPLRPPYARRPFLPVPPFGG